MLLPNTVFGRHTVVARAQELSDQRAARAIFREVVGHIDGLKMVSGEASKPSGGILRSQCVCFVYFFPFFFFFSGQRTSKPDEFVVQSKVC